VRVSNHYVDRSEETLGPREDIAQSRGEDWVDMWVQLGSGGGWPEDLDSTAATAYAFLAGDRVLLYIIWGSTTAKMESLPLIDSANVIV
jgi:hypothetical protein